MMFYNWLRNNGLSISFFGLFIGALIAQSITGFDSYVEKLAAYHRPAISFAQYLVTGDFLEGIFSNWQAAILQLGCLIVFGTALRQKGAPHSRKPETDSSRDGRDDNGKSSWVYRHSLSLAFAAMFVASFLGHIVFGSKAYNETRALTGETPVSAASYVLTGNFWFKTVQTWQAEFIGIGLYIVLSIFLRQQGSSESKPVHSSDDETGEANK